MKRIAVLMLLALMPSLASAASHSRKHMAAVVIPVPGAFVVSSEGTPSDETFGVTNEASPYFDNSGVPIDRPWVHIQTASSNYQPDYSLSASANAPADSVCTLLAGTPFEIRWHSLHVGYGDHVDGTGRHADFDDGDIWFAGAWHHYTNAQRNTPPENVNGANITVFVEDASGAGCFVLVLPGGATYFGPGLRF